MSKPARPIGLALVLLAATVPAVPSFPARALPGAEARACAGDERPAPGERWLLVPDLAEREREILLRSFDLRGSYGRFTLFVAEGPARATLRGLHPAALDLGPVRDGERLWFVPIEEEAELHPREGVRILFRGVDRALLAVRGAGIRDLRSILPEGRARGFHAGVTPVPSRRQRPVAARGGAPAPLAAAPSHDPRIQAWVDAVDPSKLQSDVDYLSNQFYTRASDHPDGFAAMSYLRSRFQALGLATSLHNFDSGADNVIAELPGRLEPEKVVILGAHYDSESFTSVRAPGADDNASGTAALLEVARILTQAGAEFRYTIRFVCFASEEFGLLGSDAYSGLLTSLGVEVVAMLNTDMNAYRAPGDASDLDMVTSDTTPWLTERLIEVANLYVPSLPVKKFGLGSGTSDHRPFHLDGHPAAFYFEDASYSPYIHTENDVIGLSANDFALARDIVKAVLAGLATTAVSVDLLIDHAGQADTEDQWNPLELRASVTSLIGTTPQSVDLIYDVGPGEVGLSMVPSGAADEWIGQIPAQPTGTKVSYRLLARDDQGNEEGWPAQGEPWSLLIGAQTRIYREDFDGGVGGWTHGGAEDDWQRETPKGKDSDPASAHSGAFCFGNDAGNPGWNGLYRANAANWLQSPSIDASGRSGVHLRYARWLGVEDAIYDQAVIRVDGTQVWSNAAGDGGDYHVDERWEIHDLDVSSLADGDPDVRIRFELSTDGGIELGGWNLDDVELYSLVEGSKPALHRDRSFHSLAAGGSIDLHLDLGPDQADRLYIFLTGISGISPGFDYGSVHVDLNVDPVTLYFLGLAPTIPGFVGLTDAEGRALATLTLAPGLDPALTGTVLTLVAITLAPADAASNAVGVLLVP